jgi:hypothetical protein
VCLPFFKCILEVVFCEGVQHRLQVCLDHLSCIEVTAFQFYLQPGKQRKVAEGQVWRLGGLEVTVMLFFVKNSLVKKGSVKRCVVVMQQLVLLSPEFVAKSLYIFTPSP